jgi:hypothetical protein
VKAPGRGGRGLRFIHAGITAYLSFALLAVDDLAVFVAQLTGAGFLVLGGPCC